MESWLGPVSMLIAWYVLQRWLLPRCGVPT